ncbi:copper transport protein ATX1 [Populus alba x Populus x berolinensis]|uniref:Copper transport protein ATX1 n=1 Tax=Populus alba x Populus x berolinensis TaxID=444605 RepID=A0AAD6QB31_9ROSI|nr:copper transport protein ATX1 [Populus alba x Populus x berolinensis]
MSQTVVLMVGMSCEGCVGAVKRVLGKMEGILGQGVHGLFDNELGQRLVAGFCTFASVESYDIDLKEQKVTVKGNVQPDAVLQTVSKTGKKTAFWEAEAPAEPAKPAETVAAA